jgi:hypothetical protein
MKTYQYLILGSGVAAGYAAQTLAEQKAANVALLTADTTLPYDRPPLSKGFLAGEKSRKTLLLSWLRVCTLEDSLPQGAPTSPLLSNLCMLHYDYVLSKKLRDFDRHNFVYTRYADDILISCKEHFDQNKVLELLTETFAPQFTIKREKVHYGSSAGRNWNLGLMLNKDNNITLGYKQKQRIRAMLNNLLKDYSEHRRWEYHDIEVVNGNFNYFRYIEPEYANFVLQRLEQKYVITLQSILQT